MDHMNFHASQYRIFSNYNSIITYSFVKAIKFPQVDLVIQIGAVLLYLISIIFLHGIGKFFIRKYVWKMTKPTDKED